ncbi:MAG: YceD family protein [Polyangiaceae bacterium]
MALIRPPMGVHEFEISVADLDAAGKDYVFPVRAAWLRGVLEGTEIKSGDRDGEVSVRVSRSGTDVVVHGHLHAELIAPCARCLADAAVTVDGPLALLMVPSKKIAKAVAKAAPRVKTEDASEKKTEAKVAGASGHKADAKQEKKAEKSRAGKRRSEEDDDLSCSPDDADVAPYDGDTVVLDDVVKDEILLEIPMIPLCSEDCAGISPPAVEEVSSTSKEEGEAEHIDPRLLPLLALKKRSSRKD